MNEGSEHATAGFEGTVTVTIPKGLFTPHSTVVCPVTLQITAEGPSGGTVLSFDHTTSFCTGTGTYQGCAVIEDTGSVLWSINAATTPILIKDAEGGNLKLRYLFANCGAGELQLEFASLTVTPTLNIAGRITQLGLSGTATSGATISGTLTTEGALTLGLK